VFLLATNVGLISVFRLFSSIKASRATKVEFYTEAEKGPNDGRGVHNVIT